MEEIKVKILAKDSIQKEENILLGELVRGEPIDPRSEFGFRETKVGQNASLFLLDEHFEFEAGRMGDQLAAQGYAAGERH